MGALFNVVKWFVFALNFICFILGVAVLCINALGIKHSTPGTDGHAFFILGILLCALLCLTTLIGCYGVCSEVLGVNIIYSIFVLSLLIIQYLQIRSFQPHGIYFNSLQDLEAAWRVVGTDPKPMDDIQTHHGCCGLFHEHDYAFKNLEVPASCHSAENKDVEKVNKRGCLESLWRSHIYVTRRQELFNWALLIAEAVTLFYSIVLCILIHWRHSRTQHHRVVGDRAIVRQIAQQNNVGSRHMLLSN